MIFIGTGHMDSTFYSFVNVKALIGNGQWYGGPEGTPHIANIFAKYLRNHKISLQIFAISQNIFEIIQLQKDLRPEALFRHLRGTTFVQQWCFLSHKALATSRTTSDLIFHRFVYIGPMHCWDRLHQVRIHVQSFADALSFSYYQVACNFRQEILKDTMLPGFSYIICILFTS